MEGALNKKTHEITKTSSHQHPNPLAQKTTKNA
jgi:hypothetical protein